MTEQSNRKWMRGWGNQPQVVAFDSDGNKIPGWEKRQSAALMGKSKMPELALTASLQRSLDWKRIQREKQESKRKARWRVFWNCLLAVPGCAVPLYGAFKLAEWIIR